MTYNFSYLIINLGDSVFSGKALEWNKNWSRKNVKNSCMWELWMGFRMSSGFQKSSKSLWGTLKHIYPGLQTQGFYCLSDRTLQVPTFSNDDGGFVLKHTNSLLL